MNSAERKQLNYMPSAALDAAVNERFGAEVECNTSLNFFSMQYVTTYKTEDPVLKTRIDDFVAGFTAGNRELSDRLYDKSKYL